MKKLLIFWVFLLILQCAVAQEYRGKVVAISDGAGPEGISYFIDLRF